MCGCDLGRVYRREGEREGREDKHYSINNSQNENDERKEREREEEHDSLESTRNMRGREKEISYK